MSSIKSYHYGHIISFGFQYFVIMIFFQIVFEIVWGWPYDTFYEPMKDYAKSPIYQLHVGATYAMCLTYSFWLLS
jgi:hypothetical protein